MALTFTDRKWHDEATGTVTFPAWSGSTRVTCRITDEALQSVFGAGHSDTELVECFERCRASIEIAAIKKFTTDTLKLVLVSTDFDTRAPVKAEPEPKDSAQIAKMMQRYRANAGGRSPSLVHRGEIPEIREAMAALENTEADAAAADEPAQPPEAQDSAVTS
jgi:hypothetical protein